LKTKEKSLEAERRQCRRQSVREDGIELFSRETKIIGKIDNISQTGLAFHYAPVRGIKAEFDTIDIMATGPARFYLSGLACRRIYDVSTLAEDHTFTGTETRLCGLEFIRLENNHQLAFFLRNFLNMTTEELCQP
jgi:hypothetical protein